MKERPILFSAPMVRSILAGNKTQTRRVMKPRPTYGKPWHGWVIDPDAMDIPIAMCPYGIPGDRLWVREPVGIHCRPEDGLEGYCVYRADFPDGPDVTFEPHWTPAMHMPRWASRITLEITGVRVQRLQEISDVDMRAEGIDFLLEPDGRPATHYNRQSFATLWDAINGKRAGCAWAADPWVWAVEFTQVR